jgi:hypothetical protein
MVPDAEKYHQKAETPMRTMTIVDMKFHNGELYIAGISNEEFASTLRKVPYPFTGEASTTYIKIYHTAHAQYETRAPIRAMTFADVDGKDTLVAAYTCSPVVLIPVDELKDEAKVDGRVVGDMGNGQPVSMVNVNYDGIPMIFVTNAAGLRGHYVHHVRAGAARRCARGPQWQRGGRGQQPRPHPSRDTDAVTSVRVIASG